MEELGRNLRDLPSMVSCSGSGWRMRSMTLAMIAWLQRAAMTEAVKADVWGDAQGLFLFSGELEDTPSLRKDIRDASLVWGAWLLILEVSGAIVFWMSIWLYRGLGRTRCVCDKLELVEGRSTIYSKTFYSFGLRWAVLLVPGRSRTESWERGFSQDLLSPMTCNIGINRFRSMRQRLRLSCFLQGHYSSHRCRDCCIGVPDQKTAAKEPDTVTCIKDFFSLIRCCNIKYYYACLCTISILRLVRLVLVQSALFRRIDCTHYEPAVAESFQLEITWSFLQLLTKLLMIMTLSIITELGDDLDVELTFDVKSS